MLVHDGLSGGFAGVGAEVEASDGGVLGLDPPLHGLREVGGPLDRFPPRTHTPPMPTDSCGWASDFPTFHGTPPRVVRVSLERFVREAGHEQIAAWDEAIPALQKEVGEAIAADAAAKTHVVILEYKLPLEERRPDAVMLPRGCVVVIELKGKESASPADLDQAANYARDLMAYHRHCQDRPVHAVLIPTRAAGLSTLRQGVHVVSPERLDELLAKLPLSETAPSVSTDAFISEDAYRPLPTLVQAARELLESKTIREVWRAKAATDPAVDCIQAIAHEAAASKSRHLVLITGVPGSGKTLVGLRVVHARYLDDLAPARAAGRPTVPALFLSGNGPLVQVLQYTLRTKTTGGQTFVRAVPSYLDSLVPRPAKIPNENVLVFDEAQRAFSREKVADLHDDWPPQQTKSEPEHFIDICDRMPEWSVMVGLIGTGQEIHVGEEEGLEQWAAALMGSSRRGEWTVHAPPSVAGIFSRAGLPVVSEERLNLVAEIRYHLVNELHGFVDSLLNGKPIEETSLVAERLRDIDADPVKGLRLYLTRDLEVAKRYLWDSYKDDPEARFGILASSRDNLLERYGIQNGFHATKQVRLGPWYSMGQERAESCRQLDKTVTEFGSQGLELTMALVCWGSDLIRVDGKWTSHLSRKYARGGVKVRDPHQLRVNAYRVLMTRGRDGAVVYVPKDTLLDETYDYLCRAGFGMLDYQ